MRTLTKKTMLTKTDTRRWGKNDMMRPNEIEKRSFEIIEAELAARRGGDAPARSPLEEAVVRRVIHATADFDGSIVARGRKGGSAAAAIVNALLYAAD